METIVNNLPPVTSNPAPIQEIVRDDGGGWAVALVLLLVLVVGGYFGWNYLRRMQPVQPAATTIQVNLPSVTGNTDPAPTQ